MPFRVDEQVSSRVFMLGGWRPLEVSTGVHGLPGRDVREGYRRGWGLQFGSLADEVELSKLFKEAFDIAQDEYSFSLLSPVRLMNLYLLVKQVVQLESANIVEFGSFRGGTAFFLAHILRELSPGSVMYSLDTFEGLPSTTLDVDLHRKGDFDSVDIDRLEERKRRLGLQNLVFLRGEFRETVSELRETGLKFGLAHIDCDVRESVDFATSSAWTLMSAGGYLVFDDANISSCIGATESVEKFVMQKGIHCEQAWPHLVFRVEEKRSSDETSALTQLISRGRQTRRFKPVSLPDAVKDELLSSLSLVPSVGNTQPWRFVQIASDRARTILKKSFQVGDAATRATMMEERLKLYDRLQVESFLDAPLQFSVFTETVPSVGDQQGWAIMPDALVHSTVGALYYLWLIAESLGLGFSWITTIDDSSLRQGLDVPPTWKFTAHIAIGFAEASAGMSKHEATGFRSKSKPVIIQA